MMIKILVSISHVIAAVFCGISVAAALFHQFDAATYGMLVAIFFQLKTMRPRSESWRDDS